MFSFWFVSTKVLSKYDISICVVMGTIHWLMWPFRKQLLNLCTWRIFTLGWDMKSKYNLQNTIIFFSLIMDVCNLAAIYLGPITTQQSLYLSLSTPSCTSKFFLEFLQPCLSLCSLLHLFLKITSKHIGNSPQSQVSYEKQFWCYCTLPGTHYLYIRLSVSCVIATAFTFLLWELL